MKRRVGIAAIMAVSLVMTACGQKPGVADLESEGIPVRLALPAGVRIDPDTGRLVDSQGRFVGDLGSLAGSPQRGGLETAEDAALEDPRDTSAVSAEGTSAAAPAVGGDATGVTSGSIKIGAHAPLTGAAPIPSDSAQKGNALYWEWLRNQDRQIAGRDVETILRDDNYNPSQAVAVCKEMVTRDQVFLLYGFAGTDQIQACARYAASVGVPYVSVGVTEAGLTSLPGYLAISLSYAEQGVLLADLVTGQLNGRRAVNGMVRFDTPNFQDAHDSFFSAMKRNGARVAFDQAVSKNAGSSEAQSVVQALRSRGVENVYVLTSPVWFLQLLQAARSQGYEPQWIGVGITKALDSVATLGCRNGTLNGAKFFSPFPAWADIDRFDPEFKRAVAGVFPEKDQGDDIMVLAWGVGKVIGELLAGPGRELTRERFVQHAERAAPIETGIFPPVRFTSSDHFGGTQVHLNEAQCSGYKEGDNRWHTIRSFVSRF